MLLCCVIRCWVEGRGGYKGGGLRGRVGGV